MTNVVPLPPREDPRRVALMNLARDLQEEAELDASKASDLRLRLLADQISRSAPGS